MTTRVVSGITFDIESPSHWRVVGYPLDLSFIDNGWYLRGESPPGWIFGKSYKTRDEAIALIAQVFKEQRQ